MAMMPENSPTDRVALVDMDEEVLHTQVLLMLMPTQFNIKEVLSNTEDMLQPVN